MPYFTLTANDFQYNNGKWFLNKPPVVPIEIRNLRLNQFIAFNQVYTVGENQELGNGAIEKGYYSLEDLATEFPVTLLANGFIRADADLTFNYNNRYLANIFGFEKNSVVSTNTIAKRQANLSANPIIYICSSVLGGGDVIDNSGGIANVIGQAYLTSQKNYSLYFDYRNSPCFQTRISKPSNIDITFKDCFGRVIEEINGFILTFEYSGI